MLLEDINLKEVIDSVLADHNIDSTKPEINIAISLFDNMGRRHFNDSLIQDQTIFYPASLIKLFQAYFAKIRIQENVLKTSHELINRAVEESSIESLSFGTNLDQDDVQAAIIHSLKDSDNDALGYLVDYNTRTNSGLRLDPKILARFRQARSAVTEFFINKGYDSNLNIANKCFSFAPYGRDLQLMEDNGVNSMDINDSCRIMLDIERDFPEMLKFLEREIGDSDDEQSQFIAKGMSDRKDEISIFQSKAGWTSKVRHDVAFIRFKDNCDYLLAVMTQGLSEYKDLIADISRKIFS